MSDASVKKTDYPWIPEGYDEGLYRLRHSLAHLMAEAVRDVFRAEGPVYFAGGPPIVDGFYYDFELPRALIPADLERIEARMRDLLKNPQSFIYQELSREEALHLFAEQPYKMDWLQDLQQNVISIYRHRDFADLCRGPHLESSASIEEGSFKLLKIAGAYWKGDEKRPMLQRIYGTVWPSKVQLEAYLYQQEEASRRDHRKLGKELELFFFHETAPGMPYWMPKGLIILNQLINWWREVHDREDYQEISSPLINSKKLWEISGHWEHYREDMFVMNLGEDEVYGVKPMNCPNAMIMFKQKLHSYRDLPLRLSDCDALHRHERSGALHGLLRVQKFQQDDAHIFVAEEGIEAEFDGILNLVEEFYSVFGLSYRFRLATRPKDSIGNDELWEQAEGALKDVLHRKVGEAYELAEGDGAFYGPKIDILIKDALGRDWQMGTLQLDYQLPRRFECQYIDASGKKRYPVVIHRVIYGSLERFIGILIEHSAGLLPLWLAPVQVRIIPVGEAQMDYALALVKQLKAAKIRVELDKSSESLGRKVKNFRLDKIPYALVVGQKEKEAGMISVRKRGEDHLKVMPVEEWIQSIQEEIVAKSNS